MPESAADEAVRCAEAGHEQSRVRKRGKRPSARGLTQRYQCIGEGQKSHYFSVPIDEPVQAPPDLLRCPDPRHADGRLQKRGPRTTKAGVVRRYRCIRPNGSKHQFQVLEGPDGTLLSSLSQAPPCSDHPESHVIRNGGYGQHRRKQRYLCTPLDGSKTHSFTPPLSRQTVDVGTASCTTCDELLSPHRGTLTGARHTPWPLTVITQALNELSLGESYSSVSLRMRARRDVAVAHLRQAHGLEVTLGSSVGGSSESVVSKQGRAAWHLAANLVEQYSPLLYAQVRAAMEAREQAQRAANDDALAADPQAALAAPLTYILDEQPIELPQRRSGRTRYQQDQWSLLVVIEVRWREAADPMSLPGRDARLRLVRAYPSRSEEAWRLVLAELPVRPDYIVADCSAAITNAVTSHYGPGTVGLIPSLFHIHRQVRERLMKLRGTTAKVEGRDVLIDALAKHMDLLTRDQLLNRTPQDWERWWDELIAATAAVPAPTSTLLKQRQLYQPRLAEALPVLQRQPQLPASNAAVEVRIRTLLEPFLATRKTLFRNAARTNYLFDLAVCRDQGAFTDLDALAQFIRQDNERAGGWAPAPRIVADPQPAADENGRRPLVYSSLLSPLLVPALAQQRLGSPGGAP